PRIDRSYLSVLNDVRIRTPQGYEVPLFTVADVEFVPGFANITRVDGMRRVVVSAEVDTTKANSTEITMDLAENFLPTLRKKYPGLIWSFEGPQQTSREALGSLKVGFPLALLGIFLIISSIFHSYSQPVLVMLTIPFGVVGALIGHLLFGITVTLMSVFGIVALAGVVVNDSIVLIECFNANLSSGMKFMDALIQAGRRRFRAIFLTTSTTFGGLVGLLFTRDMQSQFLKPMAVSLAIGLIFATTVTLVLMPSLVSILNDIKRVLYSLKKGGFISPEDVEPALALMKQKKELENS
ncbi:MAG: efflux RND transporter permease subunit, partial [Candidatus Hydrogenedentes bacterium]|nr:efflux RND transporter permease subunit [Candidatus Hydrogenedentota bacterium]